MNVTTQSFGHKVLSVLMALVLVIGLAPMVPAGNAYAADDTTAWDSNDVKYIPEEPTQGDEYVFEYTGDPVEMSVASVTDVHGNALAADKDYVVGYYKDNAPVGTFGSEDTLTKIGEEGDGALTAGGAPSVSGDYFIVVLEGDDGLPQTGADTDRNVTAQAFTIADEPAKTFDGVFAFDGTSDEQVGDTTFTYNGEKQTVGFAIGSKALDPVEDYSVTWSTDDGAAPVEAGTYTATLVGKGAYYGSTKSVEVTVGKLDLAGAVIPDVKSDTAVGNLKVMVGGIEVPVEDYTLVPVSWTKANDAGTVYGSDAAYQAGQPGRYTYLLQAKNDNVVAGEYQKTFNSVTYLKGAGNFQYGNVAIADSVDGESFFLNDEDTAFDAEKLSVTTGSAAMELGKEWNYTLTRDGIEVETADQPGEYTLTMSIVVDDTFTNGGTATATFNVYQAQIAEANVFMAIDGVNVAGEWKGEYDGEAVVPVITVKSGDEKLTADKDYTVTTMVEVDGEDVEATEIKDAGEYTVTVEATGAYTGEATFKLTIDPANIAAIEVQQQVFSDDVIGIPYTGEVITPVIIAHTKGIDTKGDVQFTLTADDYETIAYATAGTDKADPEPVEAEDLIEAGAYTVTLYNLKGNYSGNNLSNNFNIVDNINDFVDVHATDWYAEPVAKAAQNKYMSGVEGTKFFLPLNDINRAEIAQVIYNMAGKPADIDDAIVDFDDVTSAFGWASNAIDFATAAGIITGYGPDYANFGPADPAQREQIAAMMYRYAKAAGMDASVEDVDAALAKYSDGDEVSEWAREAMAWCVENGVMGVGTDALNPQDNVIRAEVAAITIRVQPESIAD